MTEQQERAAVVAEARSWLATPYHHGGRVKGAGCDCAQLPAAVYHACGLIPELNPEYSTQWHLHRSEEQYVDWVLQHAREIKMEDLAAGDLILWRWGRTYSHGGIYVGTDLVIHAYIDDGVQIDNIKIHCELSNRPARYFSLWGA